MSTASGSRNRPPERLVNPAPEFVPKQKSAADSATPLSPQDARQGGASRRKRVSRLARVTASGSSVSDPLVTPSRRSAFASLVILILETAATAFLPGLVLKVGCRLLPARRRASKPVTGRAVYAAQDGTTHTCRTSTPSTAIPPGGATRPLPGTVARSDTPRMGEWHAWPKSAMSTGTAGSGSDGTRTRDLRRDRPAL